MDTDCTFCIKLLGRVITWGCCRGDHDCSLNLRHRAGNPLEVDPGIVGVGLLNGVCNAALVELNVACQLLVNSGAPPALTSSLVRFLHKTFSFLQKLIQL